MKIDERAPRLGNLILDEVGTKTGYCRKVVTVNEAAAGTYEIGRVLGEVTATGKYKTLEASAEDGSEDFAGIFIGTPGGGNTLDVAAGVDAEAVVLYRGPAVVGESALVFGASVVDAELDAVIAQIEDAGIQVVSQPNQFA